MAGSPSERGEVPRFDRSFFRSAVPVTRIGSGELGGKARGLVLIRDLLAERLDPARFPGIEIGVPKMVVVTTEVFEGFVDRNRLQGLAAAGLRDERIAQAFLDAQLPVEILGDLRALVEEVKTPLAVRSSSLLEDALDRPFAGVYETKMVPNNEADPDVRFRRLVEAIKFVYASTWFAGARSYARAAGALDLDERMAVIIQEVVGARQGDRFYPDLSGVGRSYNFFPAQGANPRDGVVNLALGLGKTIVDGGTSWIYSPARPRAPAPFGSVRELLRSTQLRFWAVHMGKPPAYDPMSEMEFLVQSDLAAAEYDGSLSRLASTYDGGRDRLVPGTAIPGPRVLDFAPLLVHGTLPLNDLIRELLRVGEEAQEEAIEIEFAMTLPRRSGATARFGFLQLRPMMVSEEAVEIGDEELAGPDVLLGSDRVMGNGVAPGIRDVVYVRPQGFEARLTPAIAAEVEQRNRTLVEEGRPYLLIGFGRWGSSDPWLGIPVAWGQIGGARVIVESTLPNMDVEPSQGAHFFHNIISFQVFYLCVRHRGDASERGPGIDWEWLDAQPVVHETSLVRHVRLEGELRVKVDGRSGRGVIRR